MECSLNKSSLQKYYNNYRNDAMLELASMAFILNLPKNILHLWAVQQLRLYATDIL